MLTHMYMNTYSHMHSLIHIIMHMHARTDTLRYIHIVPVLVLVHACKHVYTHVYVNTHIHKCTYTCTYIMHTCPNRHTLVIMNTRIKRGHSIKLKVKRVDKDVKHY